MAIPPPGTLNESWVLKALLQLQEQRSQPTFFTDVFRERFPTEESIKADVAKLRSPSEAGRTWIVDRRMAIASVRGEIDMPYTKDAPDGADFTAMGPDLGSTCGDNAMNWARAFCAIARQRNIDLGDDPEGWMVGWFANAIECAEDARRGTGPIVLPDGSAVLLVNA